MAELDLIPVDYREGLEQQALLRRYGIALTVAVAVLVSVALLLERAIDDAEARVKQLKSDVAITQQQQQQLQALKDQELEYERRWSLLRGLRAGSAVDEIFPLVDRSLSGNDLWFLNWSFRRAGIVVDGQERGVETGYFVIVADEGGAHDDQDLSVETHMKIHGQAVDHQALSRFVRALFEQPAIKDVNVQRTSQTSYANGRVIEFDLTIVLNSAYRES